MYTKITQDKHKPINDEKKNTYMNNTGININKIYAYNLTTNANTRNTIQCRINSRFFFESELPESHLD